MKKILFSFAIILGVSLSAQGTIHIFNYTTYELTNTLGAYSSSSGGCYPNVSGTNNPLPPGGSVSYTNFNTSHMSTPPINYWTIYNGTGAPSNQTPPSPILGVLSGVTTWQSNKFSLRYTSGSSVPYGGGSIGVVVCGAPPVTTLTPTPAIPYPFEAFWFTAGGETFFVLQP